jgi:Tol biopolymer transport system component
VKDTPDLNALPARTPPAIRALLDRCLRKDVKTRLRDIGEARIVLENPGGAEVPLPAEARPAKLPWVVAALAILLAAAVSFLHFRETPPAEAALRLSVPLPDKSAVEYLALAPDGRTVAIAASVGNKGGLWLRALDSLELRPLANTDSARHPFWSPDGRSLGFFADGKLKIIPATGGPATALCDAGTGSGGAWNREGVILFGADAGPIQRANASGGVCSPVTQAEPGVRHRLPAFLPDGRHFLYLVQSTDAGKTGLYVAALNQPAGHRLLPDPSSAIFAPRRKGESHDHLLFQRENTLMAQPFQVETLQLAGDPFPVAPQLSRTSTPAQVAASAAGNGTLVYLAGSSRAEAQPTWLDRNGKELGKVGPPGDQSGLALSPDQKSVAFARRSSQQGLWLRELARDVETRFTLPPFLGPPVWSPDGVRIAFSGPKGLYVKSASGGPEQLLLPSGNPIPPSDWSRDGKYLLYTEIDPRTRGDIRYLPLDPSGKPGAPVEFLKSEFNESQGQFSPDGHWVAYVSNESGQSEIYVRPFPSGGGLTKISSDGGVEPRWRGDGKELYYLGNRTRSRLLMAVSVQSRPGGPLQAGVPMALFELRSFIILTENNLFSYSPSADGRRFLMNISPDAALPTLNVITNWEKLAPGPAKEP